MVGVGVIVLVGVIEIEGVIDTVTVGLILGVTVTVGVIEGIILSVGVIVGAIVGVGVIDIGGVGSITCTSLAHPYALLYTTIDDEGTLSGTSTDIPACNWIKLTFDWYKVSPLLPDK
jgi:hypothetical protein